MEFDINQLIENLRQKGADVHAIDIHRATFAAIPNGITLQQLDLEQFRPAPDSIKRAVSANDVRGFTGYVNKFKDETTQLYAAGIDKPSITARLDDHMPGKPSHVRHTCSYPCPHTEEWKRWNGANKQTMKQSDFGLFLEDNAVNVIEPNAADMVKLATEFRTVTVTEFGQAVRLQSGATQLTFTEKDQAGQMVLPERFKIAVPVFEGMHGRYPIDARLRYRVPRSNEEGKSLQLWYELDRPDIVLRKAYDDLLAHVESQVGVTIFRAF